MSAYSAILRTRLATLVQYRSAALAGLATQLFWGLIKVIVLTAFRVTDAWHVALSVLGAVVLNMTLAINHRPGRYMAV